VAAERFPVESGHIMMFARAVGDPNPIYHDEAYAATTECGGVIAPPTLLASVAHYDPEWKYRPRPGEPWIGSGREAAGTVVAGSGGGTSLHAEHHYEYHQAVRPGDVLKVEAHPGKTWEKESKRAGKLTFDETITTFRNERDEPVVTVRSVRVVTERTVEQ
jgi:acyl dehydratase